MFRVLAKLKGLRGSAFDIFGYTAERRSERALIEEYIDDLSGLLPSLGADNYALILERACLPESIRGFGHLKEANAESAATRRSALLGELRSIVSGISSGQAHKPLVEVG